MGGDFAPGVTVAGALEAASAMDVEVLLVGPTDVVERELRNRQASVPSLNGRLRLVHAPDVIAMDEHPVAAVRSKRDSSIVRGLDLVARGEADAFVTEGNTGAAMGAACAGRAVPDRARGLPPPRRGR
jgi:glycerol-3-phosphate acyltransferase PlsX